MVETGNECQHTAYMSPHVKLYCGGLMHGSVVPAKFLLVLLNTLPPEHETSNALVGLWSGERSRMRTTERDTTQTERALLKESFDTSSRIAVCIQAKEVLRTPSMH